MKLTPADLTLLKSLAKDTYLQITAEQRLEGSGESLTHGDRLAISFFEAAMKVASRNHYDPRTVQVVLEVPDSDPETEYSDWMMDPTSDP